MKDKFAKAINLVKRFSKEIIVALTLAVIATISYEYVLGKIKEKYLYENLKAVAVVATYDKEGNLLGQGSGFFITSDGKLVTNAHVINGADLPQTKAKLPSGAYYVLKGIVGIDEDADIAVLQFDAQETPYIKKRGDSDEIRIGEKIVAIGAPLGLESTVSEGLVSHPKRNMDGMDFIQFTAPVSSGSSGGGLFDEWGHLLGVITFTIKNKPELQLNANIQNLNFAVPINTIKKVLEGKEKSFTEESPEYFYSLGVLERNKRNYDKAIEYFKKTIDINFKYVNAYIDLADVYYETGLFDLELDSLKKAVILEPTNIDAYYGLASAYEDNGQYDSAIVAYWTVLKLKPTDKDAAYELCLLYIANGEKKKAVALLPKVIELNPGFGNLLKKVLNNMK